MNHVKINLLNTAVFVYNRVLPSCVQVPDNYTPPAPITAPVMGFPVETPQPHDHAQVPPGAPQEPSMQV